MGKRGQEKRGDGNGGKGEEMGGYRGDEIEREGIRVDGVKKGKGRQRGEKGLMRIWRKRMRVVDEWEKGADRGEGNGGEGVKTGMAG